MSAMKAIEEEKETLHQQTTELQATLMTVSKEKELTEAELEERGRAAIQLEQEKKELEETTSTLIGSLTVGACLSELLLQVCPSIVTVFV